MSGIRLNNVSFNYNNGQPLLKNISLEIPAGTFLGIIGVNGSGKSTFSYLLNGLIPHLIQGKLSGEILVDDISTSTKKVAYFADKVGMLFQNPDFSLFNLTVAEEIEFGLKKLGIGQRHEKILNALQNVGMEDYLHRDPQTLSLGEKQKVCLASVLALDTKYIVLDEPIAMLDYKSSIEIYEILAKLNAQGKTIIVIEHDTDFLSQFAAQLLLLEKGEVAAFGNKEDVLVNVQLFAKLGIKIPRI
jgi:energy-coupling factor transporter ATP-binding protein EcfA2